MLGISEPYCCHRSESIRADVFEYRAAANQETRLQHSLTLIASLVLCGVFPARVEDEGAAKSDDDPSALRLDALVAKPITLLQRATLGALEVRRYRLLN